MFFVPRSSRLYSPYQAPSQRAVVIPDHPLSNGLRSLWLPGQSAGQNQLVNLAPDLSAHNLTLPISGTGVPTHTSTPHGIASVHTGALAGGYYRATSNTPHTTTATTWGIAVLGSISGAQTASSFPAFYNFSESTGTVFLSITTNGTANQIQLEYYPKSAGLTQVTINPAATLTAGQQVLAIGTGRSLSDFEFWVLNLATGVLSTGTSTTLQSSGPTVAMTYETVGGANYGSENYLNGTVSAAWYWENAGFTSDQLAEFIAEPFANLRPAFMPRRFFRASGSAATASGANSVATAAGSSLANVLVSTSGANSAATAAGTSLAVASGSTSGTNSVATATGSALAGALVSTSGANSVATAVGSFLNSTFASGTNSVATAIGSSLATALVSASGANSATASGSSLANTTGSTSGTNSTAIATGSSLARASGATSGDNSVAAATGSSLARASVSTSGTNSATASGSSLAFASVSTSGSNTAATAGGSALGSGIGVASGANTAATAIGKALSLAAAVSSGSNSVATAAGFSFSIASGTASGSNVATATGFGSVLGSAAAVASGSNTIATAIGSALSRANATSAGDNLSQAIGSSLAKGAALTNGSNAASATGSAFALASALGGSGNNTATASGSALAIAAALLGNGSNTIATASGNALAIRDVSSSGDNLAQAIGFSLAIGAAAASGNSAATAAGSSFAIATGSSISVSLGTAFGFSTGYAVLRGVNLHKMASSIITNINQNSLGTVQIQTGSYTTDAAGHRVPRYADPVDVLMQVQALTETDIYHVNGLNVSGSTHTIYLNGRLDALVRRNNKGGDIIEWPKDTGQTWLVTALLEDWPNWCKVAVTLIAPAIRPLPTLRGRNLHRIASAAASIINPNTIGTVYVSSGNYETDTAGHRLSEYADAVDMPMQVQALTEQDIIQVNGLNVSGSTHTIYLTGRLDALVRKNNKGGDVIEWPKDSGQRWLVTALLEDWPRWCKVAVTLQQQMVS